MICIFSENCIFTSIYKKLETEIGQTRLRFRNGLGTRDTIFAFSALIHPRLDLKQDVFVRFLDYKAFDTVQYKILLISQIKPSTQKTSE